MFSIIFQNKKSAELLSYHAVELSSSGFLLLPDVFKSSFQMSDF